MFGYWWKGSKHPHTPKKNNKERAITQNHSCYTGKLNPQCRHNDSIKPSIYCRAVDSATFSSHSYGRDLRLPFKILKSLTLLGQICVDRIVRCLLLLKTICDCCCSVDILPMSFRLVLHRRFWRFIQGDVSPSSQSHNVSEGKKIQIFQINRKGSSRNHY